MLLPGQVRDLLDRQRQKQRGLLLGAAPRGHRWAATGAQSGGRGQGGAGRASGRAGGHDLGSLLASQHGRVFCSCSLAALYTRPPPQCRLQEAFPDYQPLSPSPPASSHHAHLSPSEMLLFLSCPFLPNCLHWGPLDPVHC